jgi:hypothetical protein
METQKFNKSVFDLLNERLKKYVKESLSRDVYISIYGDIFLSLQEIVLNVPQLAKIISHDGMNFLAQAYYDMILLNGHQPLDPNIFSKRIYASDLSTQELHVLMPLFAETPIAQEIYVTLKKRS